jgi:hypothetical protein
MVSSVIKSNCLVASGEIFNLVLPVVDEATDPVGKNQRFAAAANLKVDSSPVKAFEIACTFTEFFHRSPS